MKLSDLGERRIIGLFAEEFKGTACEDVMVSIGDDCAVLKIGGSECLLVSTDTVIEGTHIPREMTALQIGAYAVNVVLSDIASMGGSPLGLVFSAALPAGLDQGFVKRLAKGMASAAKGHGTCIIGGDTKEAGQITLTGTAFGKVNEKGLLLRSTACVGDLICITGEIGSAAAGFYCLVKGLGCPERFLKKALEPQARLEEGKLIAGHASACMDVSDGLAWSIHEITLQSKVGSVIYEDRIPVDTELERISRRTGVSNDEMVLYKGGDFELLFTIDPAAFDDIKEGFTALGTDVSVIGEVTKQGNVIVDSKGKARELERRGYESFKGPTQIR